ncbi:unnamed protein product [Rotaria sordida]|uniref:Uncharacterized protein n=1 Tax=Rotaria sordida TaxID=392033 RepID=A0A815DBC1_9BILA|nr:unnamed protein product [Rotaria sordida]CAF1291345.1 unnamed protein product [Rotaria sordida]
MDRDIILDIELSTRTNTILAVENNGEHQLALMASFIPTNEDCLAHLTNGRFTFIPPGTSVDIHVAEQLQKALEPCITNVKVKWNIPSLISSKLQTIPTIVPHVYANDRLLFYTLIESDQFDHFTTVELWNHEETVQLGLARIDRLPEITDNNNQLIAHLAAKALIQEITHLKEPQAGSQQTRL